MDQDFNLKINLLWNFSTFRAVLKKRDLLIVQKIEVILKCQKNTRYAKFNGIHLCHTFQEVTRYLHVGFLLVTMKVERKKNNRNLS